MDTLSRDPNRIMPPWITIVLCGLAIALAVALAYYINRETDTRQAAEYAVWCKLTHRTDLTYDEWLTAKRAGFLQPAR